MYRPYLTNRVIWYIIFPGNYPFHECLAVPKSIFVLDDPAQAVVERLDRIAHNINPGK